MTRYRLIADEFRTPGKFLSNFASSEVLTSFFFKYEEDNINHNNKSRLYCIVSIQQFLLLLFYCGCSVVVLPKIIKGVQISMAVFCFRQLAIELTADPACMGRKACYASTVLYSTVHAIQTR